VRTAIVKHILLVTVLRSVKNILLSYLFIVVKAKKKEVVESTHEEDYHQFLMELKN
jgi:hypothetical protein